MGSRFKEPLDKKPRLSALLSTLTSIGRRGYPRQYCSLLNAGKKGILTSEEGERIIAGLREIETEIRAGRFALTSFWKIFI